MAATASIIIFDQLTEDAAYEFESGNGTTSNTSPPNNWSPHEPRIVVHNNDTIRALFTSWDSTDKYQWNIVSRTSGGTITLEANGKTQDDPFFFRHPASDTAHLIYWAITTPNDAGDPGVLTLRKSTDTFASGTTVSSGWDAVSSQSSKHYASAGISLEDGTAVFKATYDPIPSDTLNTRIEYTTGTYNSGTGVWTWTSQIQKVIGDRYAYDFMYVNPAGCPAGVYGFATYDVLFSSCGYALPANGGAWDTDAGSYSFNGARQYYTGLTSASDYFDCRVGNIHVAAPLTLDNSPIVRISDTYIDSQGRCFIIYHVQVDPLHPAVTTDITGQFPLGFYLRVNDHRGNQIHYQFLTPRILVGSAGQKGGQLKMYEDAAGRMWILWCQQGSLRTQLFIYPLTETTLPYSRRFGSRRKGPVTTWTVGTGTNLNATSASPMWEYAADNYALMLAVPRGPLPAV
jgi:hypothetical protein